VTKPLPFDQIKAPRRRWGDVLRRVLTCPICGSYGEDVPPLRVVKWRADTVRLECPACGLRFSVDMLALDQALQRSPTIANGVAERVLDAAP
jgi:transcription elongation factor Elf1